MQRIDAYSFACGKMDCLNEMVQAGIKTLAVFHSLQADIQVLLTAAQEICEKYKTKYYFEKEFIKSTFFSAEEQGSSALLFYKDDAVLEQYLSLKAEQIVFSAVGKYSVEQYQKTARALASLLGYPSVAVQ